MMLPRSETSDPACALTRRSFISGAGGYVTAACFAGQRAARAAGRGRDVYVSPSGSDDNPGTPDRPFATIGAVFTRRPDLGGGDRIIAMPGLYQEAVVVRAGGDPSANLILVSQVPYGARIRSPASSYSAIAIEKSYVTVDGFDVQSGGSGHAIEATFLDGNNRNNGPHHIAIINNICHDSAGSGISLSYGDFYWIENNICFRNCATNRYQGSGISVYEARALSASEQLRIVVARNTCFSNMALLLPGDVPHSDGNGIIIDDFRHTQNPTAAGSYAYATLVENNVCYFNGGKGIHIFLSEHVTVRNNTCYSNNRDPKNPATWRGELSNVDSHNIAWVNNIAVADPRINAHNAAILDASSDGSGNTGVLWKRNLSFNGKARSGAITQSPRNVSLTAAAPYRNLLGTDPRFVRWGTGESNPDLHLKHRSPAQNAGVTDHGIPAIDRDGNPRVSGGAADLGAFEITG